MWKPKCLSLAILVLSSPIVSGGQTYVVDAAGGPGVDFTDIAAALLVVQPRDVLLVQPGVYSPFTLTRGVTILGYGTPQVAGSIVVENVPGGELAVLVNLAPVDLAVRDADGVVVIEGFGALETVEIDACVDVRLSGLTVFPPGIARRSAAIVRASRVELTGSDLEGSWGEPFPGSSSTPQGGGDGIALVDGARMHLTRSDVNGGRGGMVMDIGNNAGDGGNAISVTGASEVVVAGGGASRIEGGPGGWCWDCSNCEDDGFPGQAIWSVFGVARYSGAVLPSTSYFYGFNCTFALVPPIGGVATEAIPPDPVLYLVGTPQAGQSLQLRVWGTPGDLVRVNVGRRPVVIPEPPIVIERLVDATRTLTLQTIPAGGERAISLPLPAAYAPGTVFFAQAELEDPLTGELRRTNSAPIVVR